MVWKPKEKELTLEEAVALAKHDLSPFWFGSEPLVAAIRTAEGQRPAVFPLFNQFSSVPRMLVFIDPTQPSSEYLLKFGKEWSRRYQPHGCEVLAVLRLPYSLAGQSSDAHTNLQRSLGFPVTIDRDGLLSEALLAREIPAIVLLHKGKSVFVDLDWRKSGETELKLQNYLRESDPGLPLRPAFSSEAGIPKSESSIELGRGRGTKFPSPGFQGNVQGFSTAQFKEAIPAGDLSGAEFHIHGNWIQDGDRIVTSDPAAVFAFRSPRSNAALVAQCLSKIGGTGRILVELADRPVFDVFAGDRLTMDEEGNSRVLVDGLQLYSTLKGLTADSRRVTLRFPTAREFPVAINALRFWD